MNIVANKWVKPLVTLVFLFFVVWLSPNSSIDPWNLIIPKKVTTMIFALALIQVLGSAMAQILGAKSGAILTGFFSGLISSTATTASLARKSKSSPSEKNSVEFLTFLSATGAMFFEGVSILLIGTNDVHLSLVLFFVGPILATAVMILFQLRNVTPKTLKHEPLDFNVLPILKLSAFILSILVSSRILQKYFGQQGVLVLTFLVSLFEVHGSVIANVQLHDAGAFGVRFLGSLLAVSVAASYTSKLFLIFTFGSSSLLRLALKSGVLLFSSLSASWLIFLFFATN